MNSFLKEYFDSTTFLVCIALVIIGIFSIYSATYDAHAGSSFNRQILWAILGFFLMILVTFLPLRFLQRSSYVAYFASLMMLTVHKAGLVSAASACSPRNSSRLQRSSRSRNFSAILM